MCNALTDPQGCVQDAAGNWFNDQVLQLAQMMVTSLVQLSADIATSWVKLPLMPTLGTWTGGGVCDPTTGECTEAVFIESAVFQFFRYELRWWSLALVTLGLVLTGLRIMWKQDGAELREALKAILVYVALTSFGVATVFGLIEAGDKFSAHILQKSTQEEFGDAIARVLLLPAANAPTDSFYTSDAVPVVLSILLLAFSVVVFIAQVVLLLVRGALLVVMVAMLPVAAAAGSTQVGKQMIAKYLAWILALILYKPAAAILYAAAFQLTTSASDESVLTVLSGATIFLAALFMLPALLRLLVPATSAVASGGGSGGLAMAGTGAALATGAVAVKSLGSGGVGAAAPVGSAAMKAGKTSGGSGSAPSGSSSVGGGGRGGGVGGSAPMPGSSPKGASAPTGSAAGSAFSGANGGGPSGAGRNGSSSTQPAAAGAGVSAASGGEQKSGSEGPSGGETKSGSSVNGAAASAASPGSSSGGDSGPPGAGDLQAGGSGPVDSSPEGAGETERSNPWTTGPSGAPPKSPNGAGYASAAARGAHMGRQTAQQVDATDPAGDDGPSGAGK